ncbi:MAG: Gfo/Idh/MocA family oxidoreductase [Bacteroidales bacterium]|nr:Gfo/Idh/MocA family oxidoreductase [Bacteroidales bacterium]
MKRLFIAIAIALATISCSQMEKMETSVPYEIIDGKIIFETPERLEGQKSVLGLRTEPMEVVRVGFIGLGMRGPGAVERFTHIEGVEIKALCDLYPERVSQSQKILTDKGLPLAYEYSGEDGWKELCKRDDIDLVYIVTPWQNHVEMAVFAMENGKHAAVEVPAATNLAECWALVNTAERTQKHCTILENCVYDFFEMTALNMAQQGLFGEIIHAEGAYIHNLEPFWDEYQGNWRLDFNQKHRGDVYATHGFGPVCQVLNIHRGDKLNHLVAMDTKSVNGKKLVKERMGLDECANGDHTITLIRTEQGKLIEIQHNVMTPRPYNRLYQLTGTEGFANKYPIQGFTFLPENISEDEVPDHEDLNAHGFIPTEARDALMQKYMHPIHKEVGEIAKKVGGHGGMDFVMDYRLIYCLRNGLPLDMDVYDAAEWSCVAELGAASMFHSSMPVVYPDFTRGDWNKIDGFKFATAE